MKVSREQETLDVVADPDDVIEVEMSVGITGNGNVLYVHVNGRTILRIGRIKTEIKLTRLPR